jgi:hypothetical protein
MVAQRAATEKAPPERGLAASPMQGIARTVPTREASMKEKSQDESECLKRAAEARRFARETGDSLGDPSEEEMES